MGLYLCIFDGDEEVDGLQVGHYSDFGRFREAVADLEGDQRGSRFPAITMHVDSDGEWSPAECALLLQQLVVIRDALQKQPASVLEGWQAQTAKEFRISPRNLLETFFDVDGEPLLDGLERLARISVERGLPVLFQ